MNALAIHRVIRRLRRTTALLAITGVLGGVVAVEHAGMPDMHISDMAVFCLAVLPAVGLLGGGHAMGMRPFWARLGPVFKPPPIVIPRTQAPPARAGPLTTFVLRL